MEQHIHQGKKARDDVAPVRPHLQRPATSTDGTYAHRRTDAHERSSRDKVEPAKKINHNSIKRRINRTENDGRDDIL